MSPVAGEDRDDHMLGKRKMDEQSEVAEAVLPEFTRRISFNGGLRIDTDTIDLENKNDYFTMLWLARIAAASVIQERRRIEDTIVQAYSAAHADGERDHHGRLEAAFEILHQYIQDNPNALNLWAGTVDKPKSD